jgi:hypothetical protein
LGFVGYPPYPGKRPVLGPSGPPSPGGPVLGCFGVPWGGPKVPCFGTRGTYREVSTDIIWHPPRGGPGRPWGRPWEALGGPGRPYPPYPPYPCFGTPPYPQGTPKPGVVLRPPPTQDTPIRDPPTQDLGVGYPGPRGVPRTQGGYPGPTQGGYPGPGGRVPRTPIQVPPLPRGGIPGPPLPRGGTQDPGGVPRAYPGGVPGVS